MFGNSSIGFLLLITHFLACLTVGFLFRFWKYKSISTSSNINSSKNDTSISLTPNISFSNLGEILATSISNATSTLLMIGGFVVIFSVIISIFKASRLLNILTFTSMPFFNFFHIPNNFVAPTLTGFLEITNGIALIASIPMKAISTNIILTSFLLGIGGFSVFLQVLSITSKTDLSVKPYIIGKVLHGVISAFYTFTFIQLFPIFNFNL